MESKTTIEALFNGRNNLRVPSYQRAYSWETPKPKSKKKTHTDVFIKDLEQYIGSKNNSLSAAPYYYFGHFLFEEKVANNYNVIDGQQRLTTIIIFLSAVFNKLEKTRSLSDEEEILKENIIKRRGNIFFETVDYDNRVFVDYVIEGKKNNHKSIPTESARRIIRAFDYFTAYLDSKDDDTITKLLWAVSKASCTTHKVVDESEAIQMFIFQNNRGKSPTNLEVIKAQFMYHVHLYGYEEKALLLKELKDRFETIYKSISKIEYSIGEDEVLNLTLRVYFNTLDEGDAMRKISDKLAEDAANKSAEFVKQFTLELENSFDSLSRFFKDDDKDNINIHSLITLGGIGIALPFILKAYKYNLSTEEIGKLCHILESLVLRHRLIGTRAELVTRMNGVYKRFKESDKTLNHIEKQVWDIKNVTSGWWSYWNNEELEKAIQGSINHKTARFILWRYENHLESSGKSGYNLRRFDTIQQPELEHIAPTKEPAVRPHGYDNYDDEFRNEYQDCLGNYLLLSKSHNASASNDPFYDKIKDYTYLEQQREIVDFIEEDKIWTREAIAKRKEKICEFILTEF